MSLLSRVVALIVTLSHFFASFHGRARLSFLLLATQYLGIASQVNRIEQQLFRAELGDAVCGWSEVSPGLPDGPRRAVVIVQSFVQPVGCWQSRCAQTP